MRLHVGPAVMWPADAEESLSSVQPIATRARESTMQCKTSDIPPAARGSTGGKASDEQLRTMTSRYARRRQTRPRCRVQALGTRRRPRSQMSLALQRCMTVLSESLVDFSSRSPTIGGLAPASVPV